MSNSFARLQGLLPQRGNAAPSKIDLKADALLRWIEELPWRQPEQVACLMLAGLREVNRTQLKPQRRIEVLEALRWPVCRLLDESAALHADTFPMTAPRQRVSSNVQEVERELVLGYVSAICDLCAPAGTVPLLQGGVAAMALTRAIQHQGARLRNTYLAHSAPEAGVWRCLHDLFLFAVSIRCDDKSVADALTKGGKTSARKAYAQALLHAFAKPYNFTQKENQALGAALPLLSMLCDVRPGLAPQGAITVCTDGDHAPPSPQFGRRVEVASLWLLDVSALVSAFEAALAKNVDSGAATISIAVPGVGGAELPADLAKRLAGVWAGRCERASTRINESFEVDTAVGMYAVHSVLAGGLDFNAYRHADAASAPHIPACVQAQFARTQVLDRSSGGYRMRWSAGSSVRLRVGEIVAFASARDAQTSWMIGMLRWLRVDESGAVEGGVETLALEAEAVSVVAYDVRGLAEPPMRGVLIADGVHAGGEGARYMIVSELFDRAAIRIDEAKFDDPAHARTLQTEAIKDFYVADFGGMYRQIMLPQPAQAPFDAKRAANEASIGGPATLLTLHR